MPATEMRNKPPARSPQRWTHYESTFRLAESGSDFGHSLKSKALYMAKIVTDDAEIIGFVLRDDEDIQVRVLHCLGYTKEPWEARRRLKWRIDAVCRARITEMRRMD